MSMRFWGEGLPFDGIALDEVCDLLGVGPAEIWAVLSVETRGFGYFFDRRPQILFERHVFSRITRGVHDADRRGVSNRVPGGYRRGAGEYDRLAAAMQLDAEAALMSASWGIGQVMGFNHVLVGYSDVEAFVRAMVADEAKQLMAMATFISTEGLASPLRRHDWRTFARGYNGPAYARNEYDKRLASAHARMQRALPNLRLRRAQVALFFLGLDPGPIDGLSGRLTRGAIGEFQHRRGLETNGTLDDRTEARLVEEAFGNVGRHLLAS